MSDTLKPFHTNGQSQLIGMNHAGYLNYALSSDNGFGSTPMQETEVSMNHLVYDDSTFQSMPAVNAGFLWGATQGSGSTNKKIRVFKIKTLDSSFTEYVISALSGSSTLILQSIAKDPTGYLYVVGWDNYYLHAGKVWQIDNNGILRNTFDTNGLISYHAIASVIGGDGNFWYLEYYWTGSVNVYNLVRVTPTGVVTRTLIPSDPLYYTPAVLDPKYLTAGVLDGKSVIIVQGNFSGNNYAWCMETASVTNYFLRAFSGVAPAVPVQVPFSGPICSGKINGTDRILLVRADGHISTLDSTTFSFTDIDIGGGVSDKITNCSQAKYATVGFDDCLYVTGLDSLGSSVRTLWKHYLRYPYSESSSTSAHVYDPATENYFNVLGPDNCMWINQANSASAPVDFTRISTNVPVSQMGDITDMGTGFQCLTGGGTTPVPVPHTISASFRVQVPVKKSLSSSFLTHIGMLKRISSSFDTQVLTPVPKTISASFDTGIAVARSETLSASFDTKVLVATPETISSSFRVEVPQVKNISSSFDTQVPLNSLNHISSSFCVGVIQPALSQSQLRVGIHGYSRAQGGLQVQTTRYEQNPVTSLTSVLNPYSPILQINGDIWAGSPPPGAGNYIHFENPIADCGLVDWNFSLNYIGGTFSYASINETGHMRDKISFANLPGTIVSASWSEGSAGKLWQVRGVFGSRAFTRQLLLLYNAAGIAGLIASGPMHAPLMREWQTISQAAVSIGRMAGIGVTFAATDALLPDMFAESGMSIGDALQSLASRAGGILLWTGVTDEYVILGGAHSWGGWAGWPDCSMIRFCHGAPVLDEERQYVTASLQTALNSSVVSMPSALQNRPPAITQIYTTRNRPPKPNPDTYKTAPDTVVEVNPDVILDDINWATMTMKLKLQNIVAPADLGDDPASNYLTTAAAYYKWYDYTFPFTVDPSNGVRRIQISSLPFPPTSVQDNHFQLSVGYSRDLTNLRNSYNEGIEQLREATRTMLQIDQQKLRFIKIGEGQAEGVFFGSIPLPGCSVGITKGASYCRGRVASVSGSRNSLSIQTEEMQRIEFYTASQYVDYYWATGQGGH